MLLLHLTKGQIFRYMFLPEILPRLASFFNDGFRSLAVFMALVYRSVKLLPENHPYLRPSMSGQFTIRDVITAASAELKFDRKHIDQIIIFFALIAGVILLALQFILLLGTLLVNSASAADMPSNYADFFKTPNPSEDIALRLLDSVFGIPDLFGSKDAGTTAYHEALQGLFQLYSIGLLVVGAIILAYFVFVVLAETAQTGTPFGKRYNHAWAPIRLVVGIALLIPIGSGFNSAQWITLYAAKFGSGFATVGWNKFTDVLQGEFIKKEEALATPNIPSLKDLSAFMTIVHACKLSYVELEPNVGNAIQGYVINSDSNTAVDLPLLYSGAQEHANGGVITIVFGQKNETQFSREPGGVFPFCGKIALTDSKALSQDGEEVTADNIDPYALIQAGYYALITRMWDDSVLGGVRDEDMPPGTKTVQIIPDAAKKIVIPRIKNNKSGSPEPNFKTNLEAMAKAFIADIIGRSRDKIEERFENDPELQKYGWGGAGIWYNRIAGMNGQFTQAILNKPQIKKYPHAMEYTCEERRQNDNSVNANNCYDTELSESDRVLYPSDEERKIANVLADTFNYWHVDPDDITGNIFVDVVNWILGTEGIFDMCKNADIHPLAQLSSAGKGLVDAAIRNIGFSIGGGIASIIPVLGPVAAAAGGMFQSVATIGLLIGFILFYMVPLLPFLYFFFAVGTWIRGIFEAMVGVPLWALAHIRIDGDGLPGDAATTGYFLIFEVFIRPILILFGLLASVVIFAAMVKVLNEVFHLAASNLSGFDGQAATTCGANAPSAGEGPDAAFGTMEYFRGPVDQFFFTVLYAIIVYLTAMSSFKLIDRIPNEILRWMGSGDKTFSDDAGQTAEGVLSKVAIGGSLMGPQLAGAASKAGESASNAASGVKNLLSKK